MIESMLGINSRLTKIDYEVFSLITRHKLIGIQYIVNVINNFSGSIQSHYAKIKTFHYCLEKRGKCWGMLF